MEGHKTHKTCAVYKCSNRIAPIFRFPHPKRGLDRFMAWVKATNNPKFAALTNDQIYRRGFMCFLHFRREDYVQGTQRLHQSAVPTILPPRDDPVVTTVSLEANKIDAPTVVSQTNDLIFLTPKKECPHFYFMANFSPRVRRTPNPQSLTTALEGRNVWNSGSQVRQLKFGEEDGINEQG
ncbi:uncharacterized protein LOC135133189 [Zophobas morio]|uniref:uncharacterized protein LOC135133189 n=1 Tax=Zophobas morio TaxID=2755281 RepID=UPI0030839112